MPQFDVTAPTGKTYTVNAPEGATQDQIIQYVQQQVGPAETPQLSGSAPKKGLIDSFTSSIGRGIDRAGITLGDELPALLGSALGQDDYARRQLEEAELSRANLEALNPTQIKSYKDIDGVGDFLTYAAESIGENIPNIIGIAGGTGVAAFGAKKLAGSAIKKKLKKETIDKEQIKLRASLAEAQTAAGNQAIMPAAFLGSYALNAPEVFSNIYDATGDLAPGAALLTGSVSAALDSILPTAVVKRLRANPALKAKVVAEAMKKTGATKEVLGSIGLGAGKGFALEGVTESTQEALSLAAERIVGENYEALTSEDFDRLIESGLRGALAGGAFGAAGGTQEGVQVRSAVKQRAQAKKDNDAFEEQRLADIEENKRLQGEQDQDATGEITDTTKLQQDDLFSSGDAQYDTELKKLQTKYDKELEKPQARVKDLKDKINEQEAAGRSTASLESALVKPEQEIAKIEAKREQAFNKLQETTLDKTKGQIDLFGETTDPVTEVGVNPTAAKEAEYKTWQADTKIKAAKLKKEEADLAKQKKVEDKAAAKAANKTKRDELNAAKDQLAFDTYEKLNNEYAEEGKPFPKIEKKKLLEYAETGKNERIDKLIAEVKARKLKAAENEQKRIEGQTAAATGEETTGTPTQEGFDRPTEDAPTETEGAGAGVGEVEAARFNALPEEEQQQEREVAESFGVQFRDELPKFIDNNQSKINKRQMGVIEDYFTFFKENKRYPSVFSANANEARVAKAARSEAAVLTASLGFPDILPKSEVILNSLENVRTSNALKNIAAAKEKAAEEKTAEEKNKPTKKKKPTKKPTDEVISTFTTAKGSTYTRYSDSTTIRNRAERGDKEGSGVQPRSGKTVYMTYDDANSFGRLFQKGERGAYKLVPDSKNNTARLVFVKNYDSKKIGDNATDPVPFFIEPKVGLIPIEIVNSINTKPRNIHFGSPITEVSEVTKIEKNKPEDVVDGVPSYSSIALAGVTTPSTVEETVSRLAEFGVDVANNERVSITATVAEAGLGDVAGITDKTQGVVIRDKAYLFTDNIQAGNELGVFLHEVGTHIGMVNLLGRPNYNYLTKKINQFAANNDGSKEHEIAKAAANYIAEIEKSTGQKLNPEIKNHEMIAYFVEIAVQNGINPSSKKQSRLGTFFKRLMQNVKSVLRRLGWANARDIDVQSVVDLAYGGAQLAIRAPNKKLSYLSSRLLFSQASNAEGIIGIQNKLLGVADDITYNPKFAFAVDRVSNGMDTLGNIFYGSLSFDQLVDQANRFSPALAEQIKKLGELVASKRAKTDEYNRDISQVLIEVTRLRDTATQGLPKEQSDKLVEEFNTVTNMSSVTQTDLRKSRAELVEDVKTRDPELGPIDFSLVTRFENLPSELQEAYRLIINSNEKYGNLMLDYLTNKLGAIDKDSPQYQEVLSAAQKLRIKLESNRIVPYVALVRNGDHWIDVEIPTDSGAKRYTEAFNSNTEAKRALRSMEVENKKVEEANKKRKDKEPIPFVIARGVYKRTSKDSLQNGGGEVAAYQQILKLLSEMDKPLPTGNSKQDAKAKEDHTKLFSSMVESYYNSFPSDSLRQHFKKRDGVLGFNNNVIQNFAQTSIKMANEISALETSAELNNQIEAIVQAEGGKVSAGAEAGIRNEIIKRSSFLRNPNPPILARKLSALGYNMYLAGNISSAVVNLTQLPLVTYPKLVAEFGFVPATNMILKILKQYFKNLFSPSTGRDNNTTLTVPGINASLADVTIFTNDVLKDKGMDKLYTTSLQRNAIRRTTSQELQEARNEFTNIGSTMDRLMLAANWSFQNSERANREVGIKAAYELAIDNFTKLKAEGKLNKTTEQIQDLAIERALKITEEASGTALQELGPRYFQGPIGKVLGTFKRFVFSQLYLQYKLMFNSVGKVLPKNHKSDSSMPIDPDTGAPIDAIKFARRQLAFITIMATTFAGARGIPGMFLAEAMYELGADEDDPDYQNFDQYMKIVLGDVAHRGPLNHLLGIDMSNRVGFNSMLFRHDARRMEDYGYVLGTAVGLAGPVPSLFIQIGDGIKRASDDSRRDPVMDAVQMIMPSAIRNPMKGIRYYVQGAVDKAGRPVVEDINLYNSLMQGVGFSSIEVADAYEDSNIMYTQKRRIEDKKRSLLNKRFFAHYAGDFDGVAEIDDKIRKYNQSKNVKAFRLQISGDTKLRSLKMKIQEANKTYKDVIAPREVRERAAEAMGGLDIGDD